MKTLLQMLMDQKGGWGNAPAAPNEAAWVDDAGNIYGADNKIIQKGVAPDQPRSWGEIALGMATAPAKITSALAESLSPYAENANPITQPEKSNWRVPPILTEAADAISAPGKAYYDGMSPEDLQRTAMSAAGFAMGGGGLVGTMPQGGLGMFAGRLAKTADHAALARAEKMASEGAGRDAIWKDTGWFQGADNKWRFEIDDSGAQMNWWTRNGKLKNVIDHDAITAAYPSVGNIQTWQGKGIDALTAGSYYPSESGIFGYPAKIKYSKVIGDLNGDEGLRTLLHEAQHAIQQREGFARGASEKEYNYLADGMEGGPIYQHAKAAVTRYADEMMTRDGLAAVRPDYTKFEDAREAYKAIKEGIAWDKARKDYESRAYDELNNNAYARSAGEAEARNVQARQHMTADERMAIPPWLTQDIPFEKQFVQQYGKPSPLPFYPEEAARQSYGIRPAWMEPIGPEVLSPGVAGGENASLVNSKYNQALFSNASKEASALPLAGALNENPVRSYHGTRYDVRGKFKPSDDGLLGPGVYSSPNTSVAELFAGHNRGHIDNPIMNFEYGKMFPFDVAQPIATEADWMRVLANIEGSGPRVDQARSVAIKAQEALANEGFKSVKAGDTINSFKQDSITSPLTGETLFANASKEASMLPIANSLAQGEGQDARGVLQALMKLWGAR